MDTKFMKEALNQAKLAFDKGEVPIGAVIVYNNEIVAKAHNLSQTENMATFHAEILAINLACKKLSNIRLCDCDLYVTLEPCPMCAGAIINSRIKNLYFGAYDAKGGAISSKISLFDCSFNHKPNIYGGILLDECASILKLFFRQLRKKD